jgi:hypothetical protein
MRLTEIQLAHLALAYQDNSLTTAEKELLEVYLAQHPEFEEELQFAPKLTSDDLYIGPKLDYPSLEGLSIYQDEEAHPFEKLAIGSFEGLLSKEEITIEEGFLDQLIYQDTKKKIELTKLITNEQIIFPRHDILFKDSKIRSLSLQKYLYWTSAAAAVFFAAFLLNNSFSTKPTSAKSDVMHAQKRKTISTDKNLANTKNQKIKPSSSGPSILVSVPIEAPDLEESILQEEPPSTAFYAFNSAIEASNNNALNVAQTPIEENTALTQSALVQEGTNRKEPITMKAFLIQKTNERLFGVAQPTPQQRYETVARYANQSIGVPVKYAVKETEGAEKIVFQLGPISVERNRAKK